MPHPSIRNLTPIWREHIRDSVLRYYAEHPKRPITQNQKDAISRKLRGRIIAESQIIKCTETRTGGFWYGNVRYPEMNSNKRETRRRYCELWTEDLKERVRAYWGYQSPLSGETAEDNGGRNLSVHHIYYQEKACCVWDEDANGYYAMINVGTWREPDFYKYYILGDPNKFIPLTLREHAETNYNRLGWIKLFENIIEEQGGKCYFTKKEIENLTDNSVSF